MPETLTLKRMQSSEWKVVYTYVGSSKSFQVLACDAILGLTIVHDRVRGVKIRSTYRINGKSTDSPIQAVRLYNEEARKASLR